MNNKQYKLVIYSEDPDFDPITLDLPTKPIVSPAPRVVSPGTRVVSPGTKNPILISRDHAYLPFILDYLNRVGLVPEEYKIGELACAGESVETIHMTISNNHVEVLVSLGKRAPLKITRCL